MSADYDLVIVGDLFGLGVPLLQSEHKSTRTIKFQGKKVALFFTQDASKPLGVEKTQALMPNANFAGALNLSKALEKKTEIEKKVVEWCAALKA